VKNIEIYLTTKISCQARHIWLLGWFPEALAGHVRLIARTCPTSQPYPALYLGSRDLTQTYSTPSLDLSDLSVLSRVTPALSGFLAGFQRPNPDMSGPQSGHVWPISLIPDYPSLIWFLSRVLETIAGHVRPLTRTYPGF
jgi:hypothetical protein